MNLLVIYAIFHIICGFLAFCHLKYFFSERFHYHGFLTYEESVEIFFLAKLLCLAGPIMLITWLFCSYFDRKEIPHTSFGFTLSKNIRWPNYHR